MKDILKKGKRRVIESDACHYVTGLTQGISDDKSPKVTECHDLAYGGKVMVART